MPTVVLSVFAWRQVLNWAAQIGSRRIRSVSIRSEQGSMGRGGLLDCIRNKRDRAC